MPPTEQPLARNLKVWSAARVMTRADALRYFLLLGTVILTAIGQAGLAESGRFVIFEDSAGFAAGNVFEEFIFPVGFHDVRVEFTCSDAIVTAKVIATRFPSRVQYEAICVDEQIFPLAVNQMEAESHRFLAELTALPGTRCCLPPTPTLSGSYWVRITAVPDGT